MIDFYLTTTFMKETLCFHGHSLCQMS